MFKTKSDFSHSEWASPVFQNRNSVSTLADLSQWIEVSESEIQGIESTKGVYAWRITPHYLSLMDKKDEHCPVRLQAIPRPEEMTISSGASPDPVGDIRFRKTPRIIHKYPNRVAFLVSDTCPVYCRHCTRKYHTTHVTGTYYGEGYQRSFKKDIEYIRDHSEIDDVLLTGGDPLSLSDAKLEWLLKELRSIGHISIIRFGSRFPVLMPQRITSLFCDMLSQYHPIWFNTHFNHPKEISEDSLIATDRLIRAGVAVQNQGVLLKGINDSAEILRALNKGLIAARIRPYYLYHCDEVRGVDHFRTSIKAGQAIMRQLIGYDSGFSVPSYIVTTIAGKIPVNPNYLSIESGKLVGRGYQGEAILLEEVHS